MVGGLGPVPVLGAFGQDPDGVEVGRGLLLPTRDHMRRFLSNLKSWGFLPQVVSTDGSPLYPTLLAELWPQARHQLCVFHVLQDLNAAGQSAHSALCRRAALLREGSFRAVPGLAELPQSFQVEPKENPIEIKVPRPAGH